MASEPGGRADKLGNEFERLWAVRHLLELLAERATSVLIEALCDDERGTEFWVGRKDGTREAHQCKRENGINGNWSVADLEAKRIITNAKFQLGRDPAHRFFFVSGDKASLLSDLAERARRCNEAAELRSVGILTSVDHRREFDSIGRYLKLDPEQPDELNDIWDFLRRFHCRVMDKEGLRHAVEDLAHFCIEGDPRDAVASLKDLVDKSIGMTLRQAEVVAHLPDHLRPRDLAKDSRLVPAISELRSRFDRSYRHLLIGGAVLNRSETDQLLALLTAEDGPRLVLVHGLGGSGKSGVVFELTSRLTGSGIAHLPLRLDRDKPAASPLQYGKELDLPASPVACLAAEADGRMGVLLLDQLDAVRWTASHSAHAWDTVERLVAEAMRHTKLRVVVVCRSFDVEDDHRIKAWAQREKATKLRVGELDDPTINRVIEAAGVSQATIGSPQRQVLRSPQGLYLWRILHDTATALPAFRTMTELMRAFWVYVRSEKLHSLQSGQYDAVLNKLVDYLDRRGTLVAPQTIVSAWPTETKALLSLNVLTEERPGQIMFAHQSYLDYLTAERVLLEIHAGTGSVVDWLRRDDDQSLFRRGQLRQVLALLRDDDPAAYAASLRSILVTDGFRFHLRHLALQQLGQADPPSNAEVDLVLDLTREHRWVEHILGQVLLSRPAWFDALQTRGVLRGWLDGKDEKRVRLALSVMERVVDSRGDAVASLLLDGVDNRVRDDQLQMVIWRTPPEKQPERLFRAYVRFIRRTTNTLRYVDWKQVADTSPKRFIRLFIAYLRNDRQSQSREKTVDEKDAFDIRGLLVADTLEAICKAAEAIPLRAWDRLVPQLQEAVQEGAASWRRVRRNSWGEDSHVLYARRRRLRDIRHLIAATLTAAGRRLATRDPDALWHRIGSLDKCRTRLINRLMIRSMIAGPDNRADEAIEWLLAEPSRFRCGALGTVDACRPARRLIRRYAPICSDAIFDRLQNHVLSYTSLLEKQTFKYRHDLLMDRARGHRLGFDVLAKNDLGLGQHLLLSALPKNRLSTIALGRAGTLNRKFGPPRRILVDRSTRRRGGFVFAGGSVIPPERLKLVSDRDWLRIINGNWPAHSDIRKPMGKGSVGRPTLAAFAGAFGQMARVEPQRFARLALRLPRDVNPHYALAIFHALGDMKAPGDEASAKAWKPATSEQIEAVAAHFEALTTDREVAIAMCWAVRKQNDATWTDSMFQQLVDLAIHHADPAPEEFVLHNTTVDKETGIHESKPDVHGTSLNCVRGSAALAIQAILFDRPTAFPVLRLAVESLIADEHPAVRLASFGLTVPMLNIDRNDAIAMFLRICSHPDDNIILSHDVDQFFSYALVGNVDRLRPVLERMLRSSIGDVAQKGAVWTTLAWTHSGVLEDLAVMCKGGNIPQRRGMAEVLARALADGVRVSITSFVIDLFDDESANVRTVASAVFRYEKFFTHAGAFEVVEAFVKSKAFDGNADALLWGLDRFPGDLRSHARGLKALVDRLVKPPDDPDILSRRPFDSGALAKVLLRLYEQSDHDRDLRRQCLDSWDRLLEDGAWGDVLKQIDA